MPANFGGELNSAYYENRSLNNMDFQRLEALLGLEDSRLAFFGTAETAHKEPSLAGYHQFGIAAGNHQIITKAYVSLLLNNYLQLTTDMTLSGLVSFELFREYHSANQKLGVICDEQDSFRLLTTSPEEALENVGAECENERDKALHVQDLLRQHIADDIALFDYILADRVEEGR